MKKIIFLLVVFLLVGCSNDEINHLKIENQKVLSEIDEKNTQIQILDNRIQELNETVILNENLIEQIESLEYQIELVSGREKTLVESINLREKRYKVIIDEWRNLSEDEKILTGYSNTLVSILHHEVAENEKYVFFNDINLLRVAPLDTSPQVTNVYSGTLAMVLELSSVSHESESGLWYYVNIPNYAEPMNTRGWIRVEEVEIYNELQIENIKNVGIKTGSLIYHVWEYDGFENADTSIANRIEHGWIENERNGYVLLTLPGGDAGWTKKENLIIPDPTL